jgi:RNA polymerase sigma-70 factor, ECF subfamily
LDESARFRPEPATAGEPDGADALVALVRRSQGKDPSAFTELIRRYERAALSIAYAALGDADRAGDVVQDAFVRAWERLGDLNEPARFGAWFCGIVRNLATDVRRRLRLAPRSETDVIAASASGAESPGVIIEDRLAPDPLDELDRREQQRLVGAALDELDETTRTVLVLRYYDDQSSKEIGELLGLSPAAVDMRLSRARQQLRQKLAPAVAQASTA